jgi:winged helix DNA-binding protein
MFRDPRELASLRLANQRLAGTPFRDAVEVVRWLGAVQAQEYPVARWSIGQRADGLTELDVDAALAESRLVRTHVLRPTWHLVGADDLRWLVELTRPRIERRSALRQRRLGLDDRLLDRTDALIAEALREHGPLTRGRLAAFLEERGVEARGVHLAYMLMHAELGLLICSGPLEGKRHTYALVADRVPASAVVPRERALGALATRYFTSHGPATAKDFAWWATLTAADARAAVELAGSLERIELGRRTYWWAPSSAAVAAVATTSRAHLLQAYDEYVIAYSESRDLLDLDGFARVARADGRTFSHVVVLDGQVVGRWRRIVERSSIAIDVRLARALRPRERRAVDDAVERYGVFVELPARWTAG